MSFETHMEVVLCFIYMDLVKSLQRFFLFILQPLSRNAAFTSLLVESLSLT